MTLVGVLLLLTASVGALAGPSQAAIAAGSGGYSQVSSGLFQTCGLTTDGDIVCWGNTQYGQTTVPAGSYSQVSAGRNYTCGLTTDGSIVCWGNNDFGQTTVPDGPYSQVDAGDYHACGLTIDSSIVCWGDNPYGGTTVPDGSYSQVSAGRFHTCGLTPDGGIVCWGYNLYGQTTVPDGSYSQVSAGNYHTCGLKTDGSIVCWGESANDQLLVPPGTYSQVSANSYPTCGLKTDGSIVCWGYNSSGEMTAPDGHFSQISTGYVHICGLTTDGSIVCSGNNDYGQTNVPDVTPPAITPTVTGTLGTDGWYTSDVSVNWAVTDSESEITASTGCDAATIDTDSAGTTITCDATSAGGTSSESVTIKRDATAPTLAPAVSPAIVLINDSATVSPNATDATSGVATAGCDPVDTTSAGEKTATCTATDNAGNTASLSVAYTVVIPDTTAPVITPGVTGTLGDNGWHTSDVSLTWTVTEPESDITATGGCDAASVTSDTAETTLTCSATSAGGTASASVTVKRDTQAPVVAYSGNKGSYELLDIIAIGCTAADALSGIASDTCVAVNTPAWTFAPGQTELSADARDLAGNTASASTSVLVTASYPDLCTLTTQRVDHRGTETAACALLEVARRAEVRGMPVVEQATLIGYRALIDRAIQKGDVTATDGVILITWSGML